MWKDDRPHYHQTSDSDASVCMFTYTVCVCFSGCAHSYMRAVCVCVWSRASRSLFTCMSLCVCKILSVCVRSLQAFVTEG